MLFQMKDCPGSAAVHDLQLSQLPRQTFNELSDSIPVFFYDWSGRTPTIFKRTVTHNFNAYRTGKAQVVFMWWDLNMDPEGMYSMRRNRIYMLQILFSYVNWYDFESLLAMLPKPN